MIAIVAGCILRIIPRVMVVSCEARRSSIHAMNNLSSFTLPEFVLYSISNHMILYFELQYCMA